MAFRRNGFCRRKLIYPYAAHADPGNRVERRNTSIHGIPELDALIQLENTQIENMVVDEARSRHAAVLDCSHVAENDVVSRRFDCSGIGSNPASICRLISGNAFHLYGKFAALLAGRGIKGIQLQRIRIHLEVGVALL